MQSIEEDSVEPFPCAAAAFPSAELACLDVASLSTLSGLIDPNNPVPERTETAVFHAFNQFNGSASATLFGNTAACADGKRIGDGVLDSLDVFVFLAWYFSVPPYADLSDDPASVTTGLEGESELSARCGSGTSLADYLVAFDSAIPCDRPDASRRLSESEPRPLRSKVYVHRETAAGRWYMIRIDDVLLSVQLRLGGILSDDFVRLSNLRAPWRADDDTAARPTSENELEVRFARHVEYNVTSEATSDNCAQIVEVLGGAAMYKNHLALAQIPSLTQQRMLYCKYDIYLYVPTAYETAYETASDGRRASEEACSLVVLAGSRGIDGVSGAVQTENSECDVTPYYFYAPPAGPSPPGSPPYAPPPPSASRPSSASHPPSASSAATPPSSPVLYPTGFSNAQIAAYIFGGTAASALAVAVAPTARRFVVGGVAAVSAEDRV